MFTLLTPLVPRCTSGGIYFPLYVSHRGMRLERISLGKETDGKGSNQEEEFLTNASKKL